MAKFKKGSKVEWPWGKGYVKGTVVSSITKSISKTIKGKKITRHGTAENPAYHIKTEKNVDVLKLESELHDGSNTRGW